MIASSISNSSDFLLKSNVGTSKTNENKESSFQSMLDKNTKNHVSKNDKQGADHVSDKANESNTPKNEDMQNQEDTEAMQLLAQYAVMSQQERASINWGEVLIDGVSGSQVGIESLQQSSAESLTGAVDMTMTQVSSNETQNIGSQIQLDSLAAGQQKIGKETQGSTQWKETKSEQVIADTGDVKSQKAKTETNHNLAENSIKADSSMKGNVSDKQVVVKQQPSLNRDAEGSSENMVPLTDMSKVKLNSDEMIQVKVGESVNILSPNANEDLADIILMKDLSKSNEFEIQLKPEELGKIKIKLVFESGKVNVTMFCENQKAADLLSASSSKLGALIENRTGNETNILVQHEKQEQLSDDGGQGQHGRGNEENSKQNKGKNSENDIVDFIQQMRLGLADIS